MSLLSLLSGIITEKVHAASPYFQMYCDALGTYCGDGEAFVAHLAARTASVLVIPVIGGIAVIAVLWASIKMIASFGEDQGKEDAKKIIIAAVVGIALAIVGAAVVHWVCVTVQLATGGTLPCGEF